MELFSFGKALFDTYAQQEYAEGPAQPAGIHARSQQGSGKGCRYARRNAPKGCPAFDQTVFAVGPKRGGRAGEKIQQVDACRLILCDAGQHSEIQHEERAAAHAAAG